MTHSPTTEREGIYKPVRAPRGTELSCRAWPQEAALRMLMNSLDEEVAERPEDLVVHGSAAKPVRNWDCYHAILRSLKSLKNDETLLIQAGEPAGIFETYTEAPRVVIANSNPLSAWSGADEFPESERLGLALFGQDAARSWTYAGSQQALHTALETFAAVGSAHFGGDLTGKLIVSGGMGAAGGTQPIAATLAGAAFLGIDVDGEKITRRIRAGSCDFCVNSLDEALRILKNAVRQRQPVSVGLVGNCVAIIPELASRGVVPDILSDLTGVCDLLNGYIPAGLALKEAEALRHTNPEDYLQRVRHSLAQHARGMLQLEKLGAVTFDFGNNLSGAALKYAGVQEAHRWPGFVSTYLRPAFAEGRVPLRWVALSGERRDIQRADDLLLELFPDDAMLARWIRLARKHVKFQGLPARVSWLGPEQHSRYAEQLNALIAKGEIKAPMVIARDQMAGGSETLPIPGVSGLKDAIGTENQRRVLNALLTLTSGASWVSLQGGETSGSGASCRTSQAAVADGTSGALKDLQSILASDCGFGLIGRLSAGDHSAHDTRGATGPETPAG